jgi:hypothetical protein
MFRRHLALREPAIDHGLSDKFAARQKPASAQVRGNLSRENQGNDQAGALASQLRDWQN